MPVTIVVGGQYGSEAKAKAAVIMAQRAKVGGWRVAGVRCGGPNAGHTVYFKGDRKYILRHVPACAVEEDAELIICAGSMLDPDILTREVNEIEALGVKIRDRLFIDKNAVVVEAGSIDEEKNLGMGSMIGSTQTGTGSTAAARALRSAHLVSTCAAICSAGTVCDTSEILHRGGTQYIMEGTQGFGLSLYHSGHYPYVTSKDTTAAAFLSEAGISPLDVSDIIMVIRTYPIRVGGNSGPMEDEITWDTVRHRCGSPEPLIEMTSVTKKVRRVGEFDFNLLKRAYAANKPTEIMVHGADYLDWSDRGKTTGQKLSKTTEDFRAAVEDAIESPLTVSTVFTGPRQEEYVAL